MSSVGCARWLYVAGIARSEVAWWTGKEGRAGTQYARSLDGGASFSKPVELGESVRAYAIQTLAGDTVRLGGPERVTVLNVWATWCTECRAEMAELEALHTDFAPRGVRVVGVSVDAGDGSRVQRFAEDEKLSFTIAHDPEGRVQRLYQVAGVPETFVIGTDGRLLGRWMGNLHPVVDSVRAVIREGVEASPLR